MKVGEYVRTKYGEICKLKKSRFKDLLYETDIEIDRYNDRDSNDYGFDSNTIQDIIKSSPNIIDLIEEHDILKIEEQKGVYTFCEVEVFREPYEKYTFLGVRIDNRPIARKLYELNIKSIVTHEQFSQMEYRIGE